MEEKLTFSPLQKFQIILKRFLLETSSSLNFAHSDKVIPESNQISLKSKRKKY